MNEDSISRRQFMRRTLGGLSALPLAGCLASEKGDAKTARANIIFLLTDDQRADALGCMGNPIIQTPQMDDLARNGVLFTNAFVTYSICCSSRASILTGQYARRHGINDFGTAFSGAALAETYPVLLRQAGYRIGFIGKYGVGRDKDAPGDKFDFWRATTGQPKYEHKDEQGRYKHYTQIVGEHAVEFLQGCSKARPFCLSVSFKAPHVQDSDPRQFIYDAAYEDLYKDVTIPLPKTADPTYYEQLPEFLKDDRTEARRRWHIRFATPEKYQQSVKGYYRLITGVDVVIGRIRAELARRLSKSRRGRKRTELALNIDIAPTILAIAAVPICQRMQGESLVPLISGKTVPWRNDFFYEHLYVHRPGNSDINLIPQTEGVVTERFKYLCYIEQKPPYEELYDIANDPHEERNLAGDEKYRTILQRLRKRCDELRESCG
jgi:arylsulfatase A-like enzyme